MCSCDSGKQAQVAGWGQVVGGRRRSELLSATPPLPFALELELDATALIAEASEDF